MNNGSQGIAHCRSLAVNSIAPVVASPYVKKRVGVLACLGWLECCLQIYIGNTMSPFLVMEYW